MAGTISPGQKLTPNLNVFALAGNGGSIWGANGGGSVAVGGGVAGQTGFTKPIAATVADGETSANYIPTTTKGLTQTVIGQEGTAALSGQTLDSALVGGGSNAG